eukprot:354846-Chlamydomonas_euryale.AAC.4
MVYSASCSSAAPFCYACPAPTCDLGSFTSQTATSASLSHDLAQPSATLPQCVSHMRTHIVSARHTLSAGCASSGSRLRDAPGSRVRNT